MEVTAFSSTPPDFTPLSVQSDSSYLDEGSFGCFLSHSQRNSHSWVQVDPNTYRKKSPEATVIPTGTGYLIRPLLLPIPGAPIYHTLASLLVVAIRYAHGLPKIRSARFMCDPPLQLEIVITQTLKGLHIQIYPSPELATELSGQLADLREWLSKTADTPIETLTLDERRVQS